MWILSSGVRLVPVAVLMMTSFLVAACGDGPADRGYKVPGNLCGLALPNKIYDPFFGPGRRIERVDSMEMGSSEPRLQGCRYFVDDKPIASVSGDWVEKGDEAQPSRPYEVVEERTSRKPKTYGGAYDVATWRYGAVAAIDCPRPHGDKNGKYGRYLLEVHANDTPVNDDPERAHKVFGKLAQLAMGEVAKELPCEGKQPGGGT